ncbi:uncharacterized protein Z518_07907 [Rhinocladiella mackenziei CBS 650.93]|uniref:Rhinocladiella mackenziei CBS 650.93 unplaced genomic scaffold supercont1.6, whole genome shotgun sequence n=1 Tax=Rhinocladiella mackenziei CBS 650.93 TaxID=1442369 RepID=A0A0D2GUJ6_9EURO|nr:uncharacterized protein Z518_07907 [Rhinocladiella mackenziei CBS 650.93]KIX01968.1 hypothetical protein Z518_07907 [Rhinocladiella mackenziei CBS 650.93]
MTLVLPAQSTSCKDHDPVVMVSMTHPIRASTLLDLEGGKFGRPPSNSTSSQVRRTGILIKGLDPRFEAIWRGRRLVGIGTADAGEEEIGSEKASLPLHIIATALLQNPLRLQPPVHATVHIVAPHTYQTIPILHALLANTVPDSQVAIELLKHVRLLQYFDLSGLSESVAEVSEWIHRRAEKGPDWELPVPSVGDRDNLRDIVLIQGVGQTVSATHRRSGFVQANALLATLTRSISQLSRMSGDVLVLLDAPIEVGTARDGNSHQKPSKFKTYAVGLVLESAFSNHSGESLWLACGNEGLSRTLEASFDCLVAVHDGWGRANDTSRGQEEQQNHVVEVVKDRVGDMTGLWAVWAPDGHA